MTAVLALDAGGTSTRALVVDDRGGCLGFGRAGSGNPIAAGPEAAAAALATSGLAALSAARMTGPDLSLVLLAAAGTGSGAHRGEIAGRLADAGLTAPAVFASDLLATFCSGTPARAGYALVAGTGAAALRVRDGRTDAVSDGLGWLLGDDGSGFWIGRRVARAVLADLDGRGPATAMTAALRTRLGVAPDLPPRRAAEAMTRMLYASAPVRLADLAALALAGAETPPAGGPADPVAAGIVAEAADRLATALRAVRSPGLEGPVVLGGGVLAGSRALREATLSAYAAGADLPEHVVVRDGALGAAVLALREAGVVVDEPLFARLAETVAARARDAGSLAAP